MWDMEPRKVLVGVDRSDSEAALQYAVVEAIRRGCGIHVVHVARPVPASGMVDIALVEGELRETSQLLLATSTARAQELIDELALSFFLFFPPPPLHPLPLPSPPPPLPYLPPSPPPPPPHRDGRLAAGDQGPPPGRSVAPAVGRGSERGWE